MDVVVVGIAGGSGSGKTYLANTLAGLLGDDYSSITLSQDSFYRAFTDAMLEDGVNFDHPESIEWELLVKHLALLSQSESVDVPVYDFEIHKRVSSEKVNPAKVIFLEGTMIFHDPELAELCHLRIFLDIPDDVRFNRRLNRDISERGRTHSDVHHQYFSQVYPMYLEFVAPSKRRCHEICEDHTMQGLDRKLHERILEILSGDHQ